MGSEGELIRPPQCVLSLNRMFSGGLVLMGPVSCVQSVKQTASGGADTADCEL